MNNTYSVIPTIILHDKNLRDKAKLLYGEISSLSNEKGYCYASNRYFANIYNCSITTISTLIKELKENGYISIEYEYKQGTKEILYRYLKLFNGVYKKIEKNNNINNNNIKRINKKSEISVPEWLFREIQKIENTDNEMEEIFKDFN